MNAKPTIVSTFSGCGGMDLGFELEGYRTVWANDFQVDAARTFEKHFGEGIMRLGDVRQIDPSEDTSIPDADLVIGGFPCQDFSKLWKMPGLDGERGSFYRNFRDFVAAKQPKAFVAENVKGLLSANGGVAIKTVVEDLQAIEPGYLVKPLLYNFANYGVPQLRERLLIVGIRRDTGFLFRHPKPTHGVGTTNPWRSSMSALNGVKIARFNNEYPRHSAKVIRMLEAIGEGGNYTKIPVDSDDYVKGMISHVYRRLDRNQPSPTVIAGGGGGTVGYHYSELRALTNRERARLQSFPDDFEFMGNRTEVRRQIGNAVPPEGVRPLAKQLKPLFEDNYERVDLTDEILRLSSLTVAQRLKEAATEVE